MENELMEIIYKYVPDIYSEESACFLIYRCLNNVAQHFIMRTLYLNTNEMKREDISEKIIWFDRNDSQGPKNLKEICRQLYSKKIVVVAGNDKGIFQLTQNS